jgi:hypothetical protein
LCGSGQPIFHLLVVRQARLLHHWPATVENDKVWDAAYIEARGQFWKALRIHLYHNGSPRHVRRDTRNLRSGHPARSTPRGPEIGEHGHAGVCHDLREQVGVYFQGIGGRIQDRFTISAAPGIRNMQCRYAVLPTASFAASEDWHDYPTTQVVSCLASFYRRSISGNGVERLE